jgi:DNA-binding Lrp family transcriptional regulator
MSDGPGRKPTVGDEEILDIFRTTEDPILTATEVADNLSLGRRAVLKRLRDLEDQRILQSKEVGSSSRVWWYPGHTDTEKSRYLHRD